VWNLPPCMRHMSYGMQRLQRAPYLDCLSCAPVGCHLPLMVPGGSSSACQHGVDDEEEGAKGVRER